MRSIPSRQVTRVGPSFKGRTRHLLRSILLETLSHRQLTKLSSLLPPEQRKGVEGQLLLASALKDVLTPSMNCIDVGAYAGDMLRVMVRYAPKGRHFAWEPLPYMARHVQRRFPTVE